MTNGTIKLKTVENGRVYAVTHQNDLVELFPGNGGLGDQVYEAFFTINFFKSYVAFFQVTCLELTVKNSLLSHFYFQCRFIYENASLNFTFNIVFRCCR